MFQNLPIMAAALVAVLMPPISLADAPKSRFIIFTQAGNDGRSTLIHESDISIGVNLAGTGSAVGAFVKIQVSASKPTLNQTLICKLLNRHSITKGDAEISNIPQLILHEIASSIEETRTLYYPLDFINSVKSATGSHQIGCSEEL